MFKSMVIWCQVWNYSNYSSQTIKIDSTKRLVATDYLEHVCAHQNGCQKTSISEKMFNLFWKLNFLNYSPFPNTTSIKTQKKLLKEYLVIYNKIRNKPVSVYFLVPPCLFTFCLFSGPRRLVWGPKNRKFVPGKQHYGVIFAIILDSR